MLDLRTLANALGGEIRSGRLLCPGPGHSAADRSLSVRLDSAAPDGFVVHSFAGDDPIVCKDHVRHKAGLPAFAPNGNGHTRRRRDPNDLLEQMLKATVAGQTHRDIPRNVVATYSYCNADGTLLYQVLRLEPKSFRQRQPDGAGGFIWNLDNVSRVPYRWPELRAFPHGTIFITEGEKDADRVASLGHCATCAAGNKWVDHCVTALAGRDIIILQDNDEAGARKATTAAQALHGTAKTIRIVLLPDLPDKGDVSDWLDADPRRAEKLVDVCFDAPEWIPTAATAAATDLDELSRAPKDQITALQSVRASTVTMEAIDWLWPNRFAIGKLGIIAGLPDEGKGQILCDIAARVTNHNDNQWPCGEGYAPHGNVILLSAEDDIADTIVPRLKAAYADLERIELVNMVREQGRKRMFSLVNDLELLRRKIIEVGNVKLIEIDPISAYLGVGKIDTFRNADVRAVLGPVMEMAAELEVAIIGVMHFNKKVDITNALLRISDSLAFGAAARHVFGVVNDEDNKRKLMVRAKNNLAPDGTNKALAYRFTAREVGTDPTKNKSIWAPHIIWDTKHVDVTATEAMQAAIENKSPAARDEAKKFLQDILAKGPVAQTEIDDAAEGHGIATRTLRRAKHDLKIISEKDGAKGWTWRLPDQPQEARPYWVDK